MGLAAAAAAAGVVGGLSALKPEARLRGSLPANAAAPSGVRQWRQGGAVGGVKLNAVGRRRSRWTRCGRATVRASIPEDPASALNATLEQDKLIDALRGASESEAFIVYLSLPGSVQRVTLVAKNLLSFDRTFWLRIATRAETSTDVQVKDELSELAASVMRTVDTLVKQAKIEMGFSAQVLQEILAAAADKDTGEFSVPLTAEQTKSMKKAMEQRAQYLDEGLLSNAMAWMRKANDDGLTGMVAIFQTFLQLYASRMLAATDVASGEQSTAALLDEVLQADESQWDSLLQQRLTKENEEGFFAALQAKKELVLPQASGSYTQKVLAEYLAEVEQRARAVLYDAKLR
eukprot:jgi/Chlat1/2706/Chrsp180S02864